MADVVINDAGAVSAGSGVPLSLYNSIVTYETAANPLADPNVPDADWDDTPEAWTQLVLPLVVKTKRAWAREANRHAAVLSGGAALYDIDRYSLADMGVGASATSAAGNFTVGVRFTPSRAGLKCTGVRFHWARNAAKNVKLQLWSNAGSSLASVTIATNAIAVYEATFGAPINVVANTLYRVSAYQTDGIDYTRVSPQANLFVPARPFFAGRGVTIETITYFQAGDAFPNTIAGSEFYLVEPILEVA